MDSGRLSSDFLSSTVQVQRRKVAGEDIMGRGRLDLRLEGLNAGARTFQGMKKGSSTPFHTIPVASAARRVSDHSYTPTCRKLSKDGSLCPPVSPLSPLYQGNAGGEYVRRCPWC